MATTSQFQKNPDFYSSEEECRSIKDVNTNPRYPYFTQTHFTAGDEEQFETYRDPTNMSPCLQDIDLSANAWKDWTPEQVNWEKYRDITAKAVDNSFKYLFHKMKKAIFVKIVNNELKVFLPFSNAHYINEWGDRMKVDPKYPDFFSFFSYTSQLIGKRLHIKGVNANPWLWYGNNCLIRTEYPVGEGDASVSNMSDMFRELCKTRRVPDCEFFINKRDFPLIKRDGTEAYEAMFDTEDMPLLSHNYTKYAPILGMVSTDRNADIPIPTWEDWARSSYEADKKLFDTCRAYNDDFSLPWSKRIPTAVFRGQNTGCGTTPETNPRLKLAKMSLDKVEKDGVRLIDAGITNWNTRPRKEMGKEYLTTVEINKLNIPLVNRLSPTEQAGYKYLINVDGHVSAYRLSYEMKSGSVILLVDSKYQMWFRKKLVPYVHYVPVKEDLSDLYDQVMWCREHDEQCQEIVKNAREFYDTYLTKSGVLDYLQSTLDKMKKANNVYFYNYLTPNNVILSKEEKWLLDKTEKMKASKIPLNIIESPSFYQRCYGYHKGLEDFMELLKANRVHPAVIFTDPTVISDTERTVITKHTLFGMPLVISKVYKAQKDQLDCIHETFVGLSSINEFLKDIPNFATTFGYSVDDAPDGYRITSYQELIDGVTLYDYIRGDYFNMKDYIMILLQISLALKYAQTKAGFVHWDLYPWNVILKVYRNDITVTYPISQGQVYQLQTKIVPVIIDYGRAHVVYDGEHYGKDNPFMGMPYRDFLTLLISSLHEILQRNLAKDDLRYIFELANSFAETSFRPEKFSNVAELRNFLKMKRKFSEMLYADLGPILERDPLTFVTTIGKKFSIFSNVVKTISYNPIRNNNLNSRVFFDLLNRGDLSVQKVFDDSFARIKGCALPNPENLCMKYYAFYRFNYELEGIENLAAIFVSQGADEGVVRAECDEIRRMLVKVMRIETTEPTPVSYNRIKYPSTPSACPYNTESFHEIDEMKEVVEKLRSYRLPDYVSFREMLVSLFNRENSMPGNVREFYLKNLTSLFGMDAFSAMMDIAHAKTFGDMVRQIGSNDTKVIEESVDKSENCERARNYVDDYKKLVKEVSL